MAHLRTCKPPMDRAPEPIGDAGPGRAAPQPARLLHGLAPVLALLAGAACGSEPATNPCLGVDCSGHGVCTTDGFWALCTCESGYFPVGATCVGGDAGDGGDATDGDSTEGGDGRDADDTEGGDAVPRCGDGTVDLTEECDDGNDAEGDGCDGDCTYSCHAAADCDDGNPCGSELCVTETGGRRCRSTPTPAGTLCDDRDTCTLFDGCDGLGACVGAPEPADTRCDNGLYCDGAPDACDGAGHCTPISFTPCPTSGCVAGCDEATDTCLPAATSVECRAAAHPCDAAENCDGIATSCPADVPAAAGTVCDDGDDCTINDVCDGGGSCYGTYNC
ncbi:MAG: hypothetical protein HY907_06685 [Deltaproteobacteria bacterium]|nr:hypothetical protein [Deltaproteobacteria bacterium]